MHFGDTVISETSVAKVEFAPNLILLIGKLKGGAPGFKAFRAFKDQNPSAIESKDQMPWKLDKEARLQGAIFFVQDVEAYGGMSFDEVKGNFFSSVKKGGKNQFYTKVLGKTGNFGEYTAQTKLTNFYTGLIDWKGSLYGLANNKFYMIYSGGIVTENAEVFPFKVLFKSIKSHISFDRKYTAKQFFNCDDNSPLKEEPTTPPPTEPNPEAPKSNDTAPETPAPASVETSPETTSPAPEEKSSPLLLIIIIIAIIVIIIIVIICCLFCCKS